MISAFGVEHQISKSLKPRHLEALKRVSQDSSLSNWRKQSYASNRLGLHGIADIANNEAGIAQRMTISRGMYKKPLGRLTRVTRGKRDKNRSKVFGKSFVPGGGYKAASKLSAVERHMVGHKSMGNLKAYSTGRRPVPEKTAPSSKGRQIYPGVKTERGTLKRVVASRSQTGIGRGSGIEGFSRPDGRGGGQVVIHDDANFAATSRHEMAHIKPKRNPVRMQQRLSEPFRSGREEGRADYIANGKKTKGHYPGERKFQQGYNDVQNRMLRAQKGKK